MRLDSTASEKMPRMKMRMRMTDEAPPSYYAIPYPCSPAAAHEAIVIEEEDLVEMIPEQEGLVAHEVILTRMSI
jgi:hypothetical protein